jgi:hypothetical protein
MDDQDFDDDIELEGEIDAWEEETLDLDWDESEARSILRDLGVTSAL